MQICANDELRKVPLFCLFDVFSKQTYAHWCVFTIVHLLLSSSGRKSHKKIRNKSNCLQWNNAWCAVRTSRPWNVTIIVKMRWILFYFLFLFFGREYMHLLKSGPDQAYICIILNRLRREVQSPRFWHYSSYCSFEKLATKEVHIAI